MLRQTSRDYPLVRFQSLAEFHIPVATDVIREDPDGIAIYSDRHVDGIKLSFQQKGCVIFFFFIFVASRKVRNILAVHLF